MIREKAGVDQRDEALRACWSPVAANSNAQRTLGGVAQHSLDGAFKL